VFWLQLVVGEYRSNLAGSALCFLIRPTARSKARALAAGLPIGVVVVGLWSVMWPVVIVLIAAATLVYGHWLWEGIVGMRASRTLRRCRPPGAVVVHTVASIQPGAARRLLEELAVEADHLGWVLALEAGNERLAAYYAQFGFATTGSRVVMPWGEQNVPMARYPRRPAR
jgi:hypothetical protein